jgi:hypothetical protein
VHTTQGGATSVAPKFHTPDVHVRTSRIIMGGACDGGMRCARLVGVAWVHCGCWLCQCLVAGCECLSRYGTNLHTVRNDAGKSEEDLQEACPDPGEGVQVQQEAGPDPGEGVQVQQEAGPDQGEGVPAQDVHMRFHEEALKVLKHAGMPSPCQGSVSLAHDIAG